MAKQQAVTMTDLVAAAEKVQRERGRLLSGTELAGIAHTAENEASAIEAVRFMNAETRRLLQMSMERRGMFLVWLKASRTAHGEWQAFCKQHFPEVPERTVRRWMATYLIATGQKAPRELPGPAGDDLDNDELVDALMDPASDADSRLPRASLIEQNRKLRDHLAKGQQQREADREALAALKAEVDRLTAGGAIPPEVAEEADRVGRIENEFWTFVTHWIANLPDTPDRLRLHMALHHRLVDEMADLWASRLGPQAEARVEKAAAKGRKSER